MDVDHVVDAAAFLRDAAPCLDAAGPENNHVLGLATGHDTDVEFWLLRRADGAIVGAAGRRGRRPLGITRLGDDARQALIAALRDAGTTLSGVVGPSPEVDRFVADWGRPSRLRMEQQVYVAAAPIDRARSSAGDMACATTADEGELAPLLTAFFDETGMAQPAGTSEQLVARALERGELLVWRHAGELVSFAVLGGFTPRGVRIDVLYTKPAHRQRGHAVSLVRAATNDALSRGRDYCVVYADRRSAPANAVYDHLGFTRAFQSRLYELGVSGVSAGSEG